MSTPASPASMRAKHMRCSATGLWSTDLMHVRDDID